MEDLEKVPLGAEINEWFKAQSLELLATQLAERSYPDYPEFNDRLVCEDTGLDPKTELLKQGSWWTEEPPSDKPASKLQLHPWFDEMARNKDIGVLAGRGFYWEYGANETADAIITRYDLGEPHVLLITRGDTGKLACPGGFKNKRELPLKAAMREAEEEADIKLRVGEFIMRKVYEGPLADLRVTAHAWPYTHAFHIALDSRMSRHLPVGTYEGGDDATLAHWIPQSDAPNKLFGSHKLLLDLAFRE